MTTVWQQQVFALDARYNAHRTKHYPNFRTLYIRRRNQLLREFGGGRDNAFWKYYLKIRGNLLQLRYGSSFDQANLRSGTGQKCVDTDPNYVNDSEFSSTQSPAQCRSNSITNTYAFVGVHHILDQHTSAVTMVKFANNDKGRLCCISADATVSICNVLAQPPTVDCVLKGHARDVTGCDWSFADDLLVTCSLDGQICIWDMTNYKCIRSVKDSIPSEKLSCLFHPVNNNSVIAGNGIGEVEVLNISTGMKHKNNVGGRVLSLAFDSSGQELWAGNNQGCIMSFVFDIKSGKLSKSKRMFVGIPAAITNINWRAWISCDARDPSLLVNIAANTLHLYRVTEKGLVLKKHFDVQHSDQRNSIRSTFCPIMSFKKGACVVSGSEDSCVRFLDIDCESQTKATINKLQGHSSPVLGVSFNYDESLLSTSDHQGLVIIWKRSLTYEKQFKN